MEEDGEKTKPKTYRLAFGNFEAYANYIVGVPNRDVNMGIEEARETIEAVAHHYSDTFGYIGNR